MSLNCDPVGAKKLQLWVCRDRVREGVVARSAVAPIRLPLLFGIPNPSSRYTMHPALRSLALALVLPLAACASSDPVAAGESRTVASMAPQLTRALTPAGAESVFGAPDERIGSGLIIYLYRVEAGKRVHLGFPGFAPISYARVLTARGAVEDLQLKD